MFQTVPPERTLGAYVSFPIDPNSRAFRRSKSESGFPIESLDLATMNLKHVLIQFCWRSVEEQLDRDQVASEQRKDKGRGQSGFSEIPVKVDIHRTGFGRNPTTSGQRSPPPCLIQAGILGVVPSCGTRSEIGAGSDNGDRIPSGARNHPIIPIQPSRLGFDLPLPTTPPPHFSSISKFVGYFQTSVPPVAKQSYAQVVSNNSPQQKMVYRGLN